ncbi:4-(cytidine 5'-diphospho)-2-C-methyl-D-erythritol kinase [Gynuella sunshinyii]|uniref:4-diphosphocytidyl-2-C-methyl-D-erythritol kinase n=1 Tax=Gynuella sunshinyii YC6258 TaxID=1445510 RepID=A0A0C5VAP6_9GAMM|nr:4-(cytidine 5'-diphospho)-2-C-methyl-D-erythritol kinase [Gynuella sunshinyii]AJQ96410.1 4-diphosphocytidyl-,-methyl-D-erythritol 2-phosphate synthase [Gynuella sunshinyii YC6258]
MNEPLKLLSPAKLNLILHINHRLDNGYHHLQTLFQLLNYGDEMSFYSTESECITLTPEFPGLPLEQNLIYKAARLLQQHTGCHFGCNIQITKKLPQGGGVGGGSSNAATTLVALNHLWRTQLKADELAKLGLQLGADVPVFVHGHSAWAEGVGEKLIPVDLPHKWFLVIKPNTHVATAQIFRHPDLTRNTPLITIHTALTQDGQNDCENLVRSLYPEIEKAFKRLAQYGTPKLTGTGACVYTECSSKAEAEQILADISPEFEGFVAEAMNKSPLSELLTR